jgi:hypothetical protein
METQTHQTAHKLFDWLGGGNTNTPNSTHIAWCLGFPLQRWPILWTEDLQQTCMIYSLTLDSRFSINAVHMSVANKYFLSLLFLNKQRWTSTQHILRFTHLPPIDDPTLLFLTLSLYKRWQLVVNIFPEWWTFPAAWNTPQLETTKSLMPISVQDTLKETPLVCLLKYSRTYT